MANHGAAAIILVASLLVAVALSGVVDARLTAVRHNAAALRVVKAIPMQSNGGYVLEKKAAAPVPRLTCHEVHEVQAGETCSSVAKGSGLSQDGFLAFNPNINCEEMFAGQWVCLDATPSA